MCERVEKTAKALVDRKLANDGRLSLRFVAKFGAAPGEVRTRVVWFLSDGEIEVEVDPTTALAVIFDAEGKR